MPRHGPRSRLKLRAGGVAGALAVVMLVAANPAARAAEAPRGAAAQPAGPLGTLSFSRNDDGTWTYHVSTGPAEGTSTSLPFPLAYLQIHVGDIVTWTNQDPAHSYTVTFPDANGHYPDPASPDGLAPVGGSSYDGSAMASSGVLAPAGQPGNHAYSLAFTTQAVFQYRDLLDARPGEVGVISVMAMFWARMPGGSLIRV